MRKEEKEKITKAQIQIAKEKRKKRVGSTVVSASRIRKNCFKKVNFVG